MGPIDITGWVTNIRDHMCDHGFHYHDMRQFIESQSLRQTWEIDLHPEDACGGRLDLHLSMEADPRTLLSFEDVVRMTPEDEELPDEYWLPLTFNWSLPPVQHSPDLLMLATEMAGLGGTLLPITVSAVDSLTSVTDPAERTLMIEARLDLSLQRLLRACDPDDELFEENELCEVFDHCAKICEHLLEISGEWYDELPEPGGE